MTHSDKALTKLLRQGWRGETASNLMVEAADRIDVMEAALRDLAEHGLRFDLTPTLMVTTGDTVYSQWAAYAQRMDKSVREHASRALAQGSEGRES